MISACEFLPHFIKMGFGCGARGCDLNRLSSGMIPTVLCSDIDEFYVCAIKHFCIWFWHDCCLTSTVVLTWQTPPHFWISCYLIWYPAVAGMVPAAVFIANMSVIRPLREWCRLWPCLDYFALWVWWEPHIYEINGIVLMGISNSNFALSAG